MSHAPALRLPTKTVIICKRTLFATRVFVKQEKNSRPQQTPNAQESIVNAGTQKTRSEIEDSNYTAPFISAVEDVKAFIGDSIKCLRVRVGLVLLPYDQ
jgi:hypothetical protein